MAQENVSEKRPSLRMLRPSLEGLPSIEAALQDLPEGYRLRTYRPGDEAAWAEIMNTGQMGEWDVTRTNAELTGRPQFDPEGLFFVIAGQDELPIGSACAWRLSPEETETGYLHMVCVLPEHRGRRLSYVLCLAVLDRFRQRGYQRALLDTHDWRLGAIKVYLQLGFQPLYRDPLHPQQWQEVVRALGWFEPLQPVVEGKTKS
jgi:mycothiol synthase